jgi:hypothetical protein
MTDHHLDPPDYPEIPECCRDEMNILPDGSCVCDKCHKRIKPAQDDDFIPLAEPDGALPACTECGNENPNGCCLCDTCANLPCRHGNPRTSCATCDHLADLAFDAYRESHR